MATYIYGRISPKPKGKIDPAESLETQEAGCREYCRQHSLAVDHVFLDPEISARKKRLAQRPQGAAMLAAIQRGDNVVAYRLDRVFRDVVDGLITLRAWRKRSVVLHSVVTGGSFNVGAPDGWLAVTIQLVFAEYEPMLTAFRTQNAMLHYQRNGRPMSARAPYGYKIRNGRLVPDEREQAIISHALAELSKGRSYPEIARELTSLRWRTRNNSPWSPGYLKRMISRSINHVRPLSAALTDGLV